LFLLAETLGRTVNELVDQMSVGEFAEWSAFFRWKAEQQRQQEKKKGGGGGKK
jgi:hypothetical protein